jgi:hypothetical protein
MDLIRVEDVVEPTTQAVEEGLLRQHQCDADRLLDRWVRTEV